MPNTKSAEKRTRSSARKAARNTSAKSRVKTLEKKFQALVASGKTEDAKKAYSEVASAYDKAAKGGILKKEVASRKRSRLQLQLNRGAKPPTARKAGSNTTPSKK